MVVFIAVVGGLLFASFVFYFVFFLLMKKKELQLLEWFLLAMGAFNGLGFGLVIWATFNDRNPYPGVQGILKFDTVTAVTFLLSNMILFLSVVFGWYIMVGIKVSYNLTFFSNISTDLSIKINTKKVLKVAWFMMSFSIVTYWVYAAPYGGFIGLLDHAVAIRGGFTKVNNPFSFFKIFGGFAFFSTFMFFGDLIYKGSTNKLSIVGFIISFIFSLYVLYSWVGRVSLAVFILTFILGFILYNHKSVAVFLMKITMVSFIGILLIVIADIIFGDTLNNNIGVIGLLSKELSFPFASYVAQIDNTDYRWFSDIIVAPVFILHARIWETVLHIESVSSYNTLIVEGARRGEGAAGTIPIDMLTLGHIQASVIGIVIIGLLFGTFLYLIEQVLYLISNKALRSILQASVILNISVLSVIYADPLAIVSGNINLIFGLMLVWFSVRFSLKKGSVCQGDFVPEINRKEANG